MENLTQEREFNAERARQTVRDYIAGRILHRFLGGFDADDEMPEGKNG